LTDNFFTFWTGPTPLLVVRVSNMRAARALTTEENFLRLLRRATLVGKPLLNFGDKVWVGPSSADEIVRFHQAALNDPDTSMLWLQPVDR
jgi:hypothetical protein